MPDRPSHTPFFPCHDDIDAKPSPARLRSWANRFGINGSFAERLKDIALDSDGDSLLVRGVALGYPDTLFAIPASPEKREKPEYVGEAPLAAWFAATSYEPTVPVVLSPDLKSVVAGAMSGCSATLLCVDPESLDDFNPATWCGPQSSGAMAAILNEHSAAKAFVLASSPGGGYGVTALAALSACLRGFGCTRPILQCPQTSLENFLIPGLDGYQRLANFLDAIRFHCFPSGVPIGDLFFGNGIAR